ncbi:MAG TPA: YihY/virulence factor BrkB family protein, partial [Blastococcus sp.]|nr:YihY/virulence factor BrkB family protein [Blastococcus sp.]
PPGAPSSDELPGIHAETPVQIPWRGWKQILKRAWAENKADNMPIIAGGVAFFGFLSIFPALIAMISIYGLVASPETVARQVEDLSAQLPEDAAGLIADQLNAIVANSGSALSISLVVSILAALWSASGGVGNVVSAVNIAYDEVEARGFVKLKLTSLALTLGAIVFVLITFGLVAVVPQVLESLPLGVVGTVLAQVARWILLLGVFAGALAVLYRVAPDRDSPRFSWVSLGAAVVTVIWALVSVGFAIYVDNFGSYDKTYGAIAGVIVLMLWLYLTCYLVLLGAEINAEAEHQTAKDTTEGDAEPMGDRGAVVADTLPAKPEPEKGDSDPTRK